ncbi:hypothetical protein F4679DRAFT_574998 [Xylaria curta]|nr:hypothetical protein F4679DRAFT_574998 [Xylaria curta]
MQISLMKEAFQVSITDFRAAIAIFETNSMDAKDWRSDEKAEGYRKLKGGDLPTMMQWRRMRHQRPWHSKIRIPMDDDSGEDTDFYHFECHDLDCLIVVVRILMTLGFEPELGYATTAVMICANHDFGWDRPSDYLVKGMLAKKLFPEELKDTSITDNINALLPKMTFENLLKHPGIDRVLFGHPYFHLQSTQLIVINPEVSTSFEIRETPPADMTDVSQINWDGIKDLGETVSEQAQYIDHAAENGTRVHRRLCMIPLFIRVMFTPDKDHPRNFHDVLRFKLRAPYIKHYPDRFMEEMSDSTYRLRAVVKMDPRSPIKNPAEVRLYDNVGVMMPTDIQSDITYRSVIEEKNRLDSGWSLGDPNFKFMLFYLVWEGEENLPPLVPPVEYRHPHGIQPWDIPQRDDISGGLEDSQDQDSPNVKVPTTIVVGGAAARAVMIMNVAAVVVQEEDVGMTGDT